MYRDPLDELIEDLERIVPAKAPKPAFDAMEFQEMAARLDAQPTRPLSHYSDRGIGADVPASTIATVPAVWPARPVRRRDPSAPWDYTGDTPDTDADDSDG